MEKRRRIELPEEIIHHILSFLSGKEAVRTTILSKSWYSAWLIRPNLDYLESDIPNRHRLPFLNSLNNTMQRSLELNRKIGSFRVQMYDSWIEDISYKISLAKESIVKAMKLGATNLDIVLKGLNYFLFVLPGEVFESETLVRLYMDGPQIDLQDIKVTFSRLKSLSLSRVCIDANILGGIGSICPLIEKLVLQYCHYNFRMWELKLDNFDRLRVLSLEGIRIDDCFFGHISRCPSLTKLSLHECFGFTEIQICSNSLEFISFFTIYLSTLRFKFDVPRIRKFRFSGICVPSLYLKTTSKQWESDIFIRCDLNFDGLKTSWFHKLREFLLELSPSRTTLSLHIVISIRSLFPSWDRDLEMIPRVEKLTLLMYAPFSVHFAVLENLFWSCRPRFITLYWLPSSKFLPFRRLPRGFPFCDKLSKFNNDFSKLIREMVEKRANDHALPLEEINVEFFEDDVVVGRRLLSWRTVIEASTNSGKIVIIRCASKLIKIF